MPPGGSKRRSLTVTQDDDMQPAAKRKSKSRQKSTLVNKQPFIPKNIFTALLSEAGFTFKAIGNQISCDSSVLKQKLLRILDGKDILTDSKDEFCKSMEDTLDTEEAFITALFPSELSSDEELDISSQNSEILQDSLIKILLGCEELQSNVIKMLMKKLPLYAEQENIKICIAPVLSGNVDIANIPRLILNHLRWLDFINESTSLASNLLQMASVMQSGVACDIIAFVPDLLTDESDHSEVASSLCDLLNNGPEKITAAVFDALSNLTLSASITKDVQDLALSNIACGAIEDIPVVIKFLLNSCKTLSACKEVIRELRPHLDFSSLVASDDNAELVKSSCSLIGESLFSAMQFKTEIVPAWISVLESVESGSFHTGDFVCLLFMCCVCSQTHAKSAGALLGARVRQGSLPPAVAREAFDVCPHVFAPHFRPVCKIAKTMVWHSDPSTRAAGTLLYELFLLNMDSYCKQVAVGCLVEHVSAVSMDNASEADAALDVLCAVAKLKPEILGTYSNYLRDALDRMDLMTLPQIRKSYTILSSLAFNESTDAFTLGMRDEMHMMLQKQLNHASDKYRHIGIIGCVSTLLALARMKASSPGADFRPKDELVSLLRTVNYILGANTQGWATFYDEVNIAFMDAEAVPQCLMEKVYEEAMTKLDSILGSTDSPPPQASSSRALDVSLRYGLLSDDDLSENNSVTLHMVGQQTSLKHTSSLLCSLVSLLATIETKMNGSLSEIEALLCCPLYVYGAKYEDKAVFRTLSNEQMSSVLDSLFVALNWFRELLSVFARDAQTEIRTGATARLKQACQLQSTLEQLMPLAPGWYVPPHIGTLPPKASVGSKVPSPGRDAGKKGKAALDQSVSPSACEGGKTKEKAARVSSAWASPVALKPFYRELGSDVFALLDCPVRLDDADDEGENTEQEKGHLLPAHLLFLLDDLCDKVKHRLVKVKLPPGFGHKSPNTPQITHSKLDRLLAAKVAGGVVDMTPHLWKHFNDIGEYLKRDPANTNDESMTSQPLVSGLRETVSDCFENILQIFLHLVSWPGLKQSAETDEQNLLEVFLRHLAASGGSDERGREKHASVADFTALLSSAFRHVIRFAPEVPTSSAACALLKLLVALHGLAEGHVTQRAWMAKKVSAAAARFLGVDWSDCAGNSPRVSNVLSTLFTSHLKYSDDPLECVEDFIHRGMKKLLRNKEREQEEDVEERDDDVSYPLLTRSNFYIFYRVMMEVLSNVSSAIPSPPTKGGRNESDNVDLLLRWSEVVKVLDLLIRVLKSFPSRTTVGPALKYARAIVESFVRSGIPACEVTFCEHQDDVITLLKKFQASTKQLQHLTCHSKVSKDSTLTNHVPALKRCLETFVFRVKALLVLHNCHEAFWLGNLKNRNLQGEEILSQAQPDPSSDEDDEVRHNGPSDVTNASVDRTVGNSYSESY